MENEHKGILRLCGVYKYPEAPISWPILWHHCLKCWKNMIICCITNSMNCNLYHNTASPFQSLCTIPSLLRGHQSQHSTTKIYKLHETQTLFISTSFMKLKLCSCIHPAVEVLIYWRMWSFKNLLLPEVQHCQHLKQPPEASQDPRQEAHSWSCHLHRPGLPSTTKSCSQWRISCNQKL